MKNLLELSLTGLFTLGVFGCDAEPAQPSDRDAMLVLEVDGEVVERNDISRTPQIQADVVAAAEAAFGRVCQGEEVAVDLTLEVDGEAAASLHSCMGTTRSGPDALTAEPDVQAAGWSQICEDSGDCFACCRCEGGTVVECALGCG